MATVKATKKNTIKATKGTTTWKTKAKYSWVDGLSEYSAKYSQPVVSQQDIANISKLNKAINFKIKEKDTSVFLDNLLPEFVFDPEKSDYTFTAHKDMKFSNVNIQVHDRKYCLGLSSEINMHKGDTLSVPLEAAVYEKLLYLYENK